jgi:hypothetical protein
LIGQVITVVILGIILIAFQTLSATQQSSWAQSPDEFVQYARKVMEVVQGAGVKGSAVESPSSHIPGYSWTQGDCAPERKFAEMACTKETARILVFREGEDAALGNFNSLIAGREGRAEQFDVGTSQKGYSQVLDSYVKGWAVPGTLLTQSVQALANSIAWFTCGPVSGDVTKFSLSAPEPIPDPRNFEQVKQITNQKEPEAARMGAEHKAAVESLAKNIVQALVTNGLCNTPSISQQTCPAGALTQDETTTTMTTTTPPTTLPSSSFAQKESDLVVDTGSSASNNGDESFQYATTTHTGQLANMAADYESSSLSSSAAAVYPVSPQQPSTSSSKAGAYNVDPWKFNYKIVNGYGLVLTDISAKGKPVFESVSVPYFKIWYSGGTKSKIIEYRDGCDKTTELRIDTNLANGIDVLRWSFQKEFDETDLKGTLSINYDIFIRFMARNNCEGSATDCYRFIPRVSFSWSDKGQSQPTLDGFKAYYKLDYGKVGLARVKDNDDDLKARLYNLGPQEILTHETKFTAVNNGRAGEHDNIHPAYPGKGVFLPGCTKIPFECVHTHWRWSQIERGARLFNLWGYAGFFEPYYGVSETGGRIPDVDPMVEPSTGVKIKNESLRGKTYLTPDQTIEIVIAEQKPEEDKPIDPDLVLGLADDGALITTLAKKDKLVRGEPTEVEDPYTVGEPKDVVVWYVASVNNKASDTFYRHGIFVLDFQKAVTSRGAIQNVYTDLAASSEIDANKKTQLLAHLNESIQEKYWMAADNNILIPENIERLFAELAQTVSLMQQVKNERPDFAQTMDPYTFRVLSALHNSVDNTFANEVANIKTSIVVSESQLETLFAENEAVSQSLERYNAALDEPSLTNAAQIVDNFRDSLKNGIQGIREVSNTLNQSQQPTSATSTTTTNSTTTTSASPASTNITDTNRTTTSLTLPPTTTLPSITAVDLHPDSVPQFFKCGETPDTGLPTLPGLDVQSSAYTAITDGDANTEILGRAIFDVTFSEPITNGPGPELMVYEIGDSPEPFNVTLFSGDVLTQSIKYTAVASATGDTDDCGFVVNVAEIDLSDFGLGEEEGQGSSNEEIIAVTGIRVDNLGAEGCCTGADISDVVIVNPTEAATRTSEEGLETVPLLPEQQLQQQQQDNEADAEGEEEQQQEGTGGQLALTQCDPSYPDVCIPPPPPDLNCGDDGVPENFQVLPPNPHGFDDEDNDGIGCETQQQPAGDTTELSDDSNDDTEPESETEEDAESEPSDSGDEDNEDDDTS